MKILTRGLRIAICFVLVFALLTPSTPASVVSASETGGGALTTKIYADGTYTGVGSGYSETEDIKLSVTMKDDRITEITNVSNGETSSFWEAVITLFPKIVEANSTDVDAISGATISSNGIKAAVNHALEQAKEARIIEEGIFNGGMGTKSNPYKIANATQLSAFAAEVEGGNTYGNQYITLTSDINIGELDWNPIGNATYNFSGVFDGAGYKIMNLTIGSSESVSALENAGLFEVLSATAVVKNLDLTGVSIYINPVTGKSGYVGAIAAKTSGVAAGGTLIDHCYVEGEAVSVKTEDAIAYGGGLVGSAQAYTHIINSGTNISVRSLVGEGTKKSFACAGGLTALSGNNTIIMNSYTLGEVTASSYNISTGSIAGGLVGMQSGTVYNCYGAGDISIDNLGGEAKYKPMGALIGQITGNGILHTAYYNNQSTLTINDVSNVVNTTESAIGSGATNGLYQGIEGNIKANLASSEFATRLTENLGKVAVANSWITGNDAKYTMIPLEGSFYAWLVNEGETVLSDEIYVNTIIDSNMFESGAGTKEDPYVITTADQLIAFGASLNSKIDYNQIYLCLGGDIDISGSDWEPLGGSDYLFQGVFDGKGYKIIGLTEGSGENARIVQGDDCYFGLFGVLGEYAVIKNLGMTEVNIHIKGEASLFAAALVGYNVGGGIDNCYATGTVTNETTSVGNNFAGGLVAYMYKGYLINSYTDMTVSSTTKGNSCSEAGGLLALNNRGLIANNYTLGNESSSSERAAEGMAYASSLVACQAGTMVNCYAMGDMETDDYSYYVGSLAGMNTGIGKIYLSYYNLNSSQKIGTQVPDPLVSVGTCIKGGSINKIEGKTKEVLKSTEFASVLNNNFDNFPVDVSAWLPSDVTLKTWGYNDTLGIVVVTGENANVKYVPENEEPEESAIYIDGTYFGRAYGTESAPLIVKVTIEDKKISSISVTEHKEGEGFAEIAAATIPVILETQSATIGTDDVQRVQYIKTAVQSALKKAEIGDNTGYEAINASQFAGGDGSAQNPYQIVTETQLRYFANSFNEDVDYEDRYVKLMGNITLTGEWIPSGGVGTYSFNGTFDGNGYTIEGMTIGSKEEPGNYQTAAFFGYLYGATVKNLALSNVSIYNGNMNISRTYTGGIAGCAEAQSNIDNCSVTGTISNLALSSYVGGLVAQHTKGLVTNCWTDVTIDGTATESWCYAGGLFGIANRVTIINGYTLGDITATTSNMNKACIGGLAGMQAGAMINCYAAGENIISTSVTTDIGGIAGRNTGIGVLFDSYSNSNARQQSGNSILSPTKTLGTIVTGSLVQGTAEKSNVELASEDFAKLMNQNLEKLETTLLTAAEYLKELELSHELYYDGTKLNSWVYDKENKVVTFAQSTPGDEDPISTPKPIETPTPIQTPTPTIIAPMPTAIPTLVPTPSVIPQEVEGKTVLKNATVTKDSTIYVGKTKKIVVTLPKNVEGVAVDSSKSIIKNVVYESSKKTVATVDKAGKVTAKKVGKTVIKTTVLLSTGDKKTFSTTITVKTPYVSIIIAKKKLAVGDTYKYQGKTYGMDKTITWSVSNKKIATINSKTGKIKAKKAGKITITAKAGKAKTNIKVTIK